MAIVTHIPVERLADAGGNVDAQRERWLSQADLRDILKQNPVEFFIADVGSPLRRVAVEKCYEFWKSEVQAHLADNADLGFILEDYPGNYAYIASEWKSTNEASIVLLEKHH